MSEDPKCPVCKSSNVTPFSSGHLVCDDCNHFWRGPGLPFNERPESGMNEAAKRMKCVVHVNYPDLLKETTYFTEGLPHVNTQSCGGGVNVTIEFFVPDSHMKKET